MGDLHTPEWHRAHPIFDTDFTKSPDVLIEEIRSSLAKIRGQLGDIGYGYPGWKSQLRDVQGMLTGALVYLYDVRKNMYEVLGKEEKP